MLIRFMRSEDGTSGVEDFLDSLGAKDAQKVMWVLRLIERLERVPATYLKKLRGTDEIWEVRIRGTRQTYRILGFLDNRTLWLTNGYAKKGRRTHRREIARAERLRADHIGTQED